MDKQRQVYVQKIGEHFQEDSEIRKVESCGKA